MGDFPEYIDVLPKKIEFKEEENGNIKKKDNFWVSVGAATTGTQAKIIYHLDGASYFVYNLPIRVDTFQITKPESSLPFIFINTYTPKNEGFEITILVSEAFTAYFFVGGVGSPEVSFKEIKNKKLDNDYYGHNYILGEFIDIDINNEYKFTINGLNSN